MHDIFKFFHVYVENNTRRKLKCVRAYNDGEHKGPFEQYSRSHGIRLEKIVPNTPHQNGVAEIMNKTIEERVRCILSNAKLSKSLWAKVICTAVDLINLSPSTSLNGDVPERIWSEKDASYKHLKVGLAK